MDRRAFLTTAASAALLPAFAGSASAQKAAALAVTAVDIDYRALADIRTFGLPPGSSKVMETASYMMDVLGPRLTGSPGIRKSGEWVVSKLKEYGLTNVSLEPWSNDPTGNNNGFPLGWTNSKFYVQCTAPVPFPLSGAPIAWTPGTNGLVSGECILVPDMAEKDLKEKWAGKLRGKWVFAQAPADIRLQWDPVARRYTQDQLNAMETPARGPENGTPNSNTPFRPGGATQGANNGQPVFNRNDWFKAEGALGIFSTGRGNGVVGVQGATRTQKPEEMIPRIAVIAEHYGRICRTLTNGVPVTIEMDVKNDWAPNPPMFNIVGEIKGTGDKKDEVVLIGGHFDSWHAATGATDNGCNCATAMEAMRLLKVANVPLKRTVRIVLWTGEEEGLYGSRLYVAQHFGGVRGSPTKEEARGVVMPLTKEHSKVQAYFNLDNGDGAIRGIYSQTNPAIVPIFRQWMEPLRDLGVTHINPRNTGSTDHVSFDGAGLPGFQFIQDPLDYETKTHHTNLDFYESLQPEDMRRNSTILACFAMLAANHPTQLPRKAPEPERQPARPTGGQAPSR